METVRSFYQENNVSELVYKGSPFDKMLHLFENSGLNQSVSSGLEFPIHPASRITKWVLKKWDRETLKSEYLEDKLKIYSPGNPAQYVIFKQDDSKFKIFDLSKELCIQIVQKWNTQFM